MSEWCAPKKNFGQFFDTKNSLADFLIYNMRVPVSFARTLIRRNRWRVNIVGGEVKTRRIYNASELSVSRSRMY